MDPNLFSTIIDVAKTIFSSLITPKPANLRTLNLLSSKSVAKDRNITSKQWYEIESSYYGNTKKALDKTFTYLLREEKLWSMFYIGSLTLGFLIIISAIVVMFLVNVVTGIILLGVGTTTCLTSSIFMLQVNSINKQKTKIVEIVNDIDRIHVSTNESMKNIIHV